ncbi:methyltransferase domain-containing protein [Streptomyces sp. AJS327]|uniref:protein-L-isoaspartate O-methyltransferase family protein n=1 Tax=Streptomyces sp. AJS327 TaxID=2545265 RepID=UPI0015DDD968|nr:methyltransferase domain-containing protein [Streptomyces sp. AJS327]MBA0050228.1 methyltransferase domain-containing protein [Streptomyces sp. AJS327]
MNEATPRQDSVAKAARAVPAEPFHGADGQAVRPCTPAAVTHRHVRTLDLRPGVNVLEIGTGSGYSAALMDHIVGPQGQVTTVDIDPKLTERAQKLYAEHGYRARAVTADGLLGHPSQAPYDRILIGTTPPAIPDAWLQQLKPGGSLISGIRIADLPGAYAIAHVTVDEHHLPRQVAVHHGGYTPMVAPRPATSVSRAVDPGRPEFELTILGADLPRTAAALLAVLRDRPHTIQGRASGDDYSHFKNWLIAAGPQGLLEAVHDEGVGIGVGMRTADGSAHAAIATDELVIADAPDSPALERLHSLTRQWLAEGATRTHELGAKLSCCDGTWHASVTRLQNLVT